jgi:hypothetical protein
MVPYLKIIVIFGIDIRHISFFKKNIGKGDRSPLPNAGVH